MEHWVLLTVMAAFLQNLRSALQKHLAGRLSTGGATYVRFAFGLPFALPYAALVARLDGGPLPPPNAAFALYALVGGLGQILGTAFLIRAFAHRNFAVGTALSKTEVVQTALVAILVLREPVSPAAAVAILISLAGVLALSSAEAGLRARRLWAELASPAALLGLASGAGFAVAAVSYRAAALALPSGSAALRAAVALLVVMALQTALMTAWLAWREPGQLRAVWRARRIALLVGLFGMGASAGWFTAMTIQHAALVRALGQIELVFTFAASRLAFGERSTPLEILGVLLVVAGIVIILLARS